MSASWSWGTPQAHTKTLPEQGRRERSWSCCLRPLQCVVLESVEGYGWKWRPSQILIGDLTFIRKPGSLNTKGCHFYIFTPQGNHQRNQPHSQDTDSVLKKRASMGTSSSPISWKHVGLFLTQLINMSSLMRAFWGWKRWDLSKDEGRTMSSGNVIKWNNIRFSGTKSNRAVTYPSAAGQSPAPSGGKAPLWWQRGQVHWYCRRTEGRGPLYKLQLLNHWAQYLNTGWKHLHGC